jgi:predicted dehydrogenase
MNKGWLDAVEHFCDCILDGRELRAANAFDALQAARLTQAALKSRESGQIVFL